MDTKRHAVFYIWHTPTLYYYDLRRKRQTEIGLKTQINGEGTYYSAINDIKMDKGPTFLISSTFKGIQLLSKNGQLLKEYDKTLLHPWQRHSGNRSGWRSFVVWLYPLEGSTHDRSHQHFKNPLITGEKTSYKTAPSFPFCQTRG